MTQPAIPHYIIKYFWGDNIGDLDFYKHQSYIIETLLEKGDQEAVKWLFSVIDKQSVKNVLPQIKLSKKSAHFWNMYL